MRTATPLPLAIALAMCLTPTERRLVAGSLADALAYAVEAGEDDARETVRPPRGEA